MITNPKIVHDTVHATKVIIDTVRVPSKESMELLDKVNSFYDSAWAKLVWIVGALLAIVGVVIPLAIQYWQNKRAKSNEKELKDEIEKEINKAKMEITSYVDSELKQKFDELNTKTDNITSSLAARAFQLEGNIFKQFQNQESITSHLFAIQHFYEADEIKEVKNMLDYLLSTDYDLKSFEKNKVDEAFKLRHIDYYELFRKIEEKDKNGDIKTLTKQLISILNSLI